jgi:hypothetical protein
MENSGDQISAQQITRLLQTLANHDTDRGSLQCPETTEVVVTRAVFEVVI